MPSHRAVDAEAGSGGPHAEGGRPNRSKQTPNRGKRGMNMTKVKPSIANTSLNAGRRRFPLTLWVVVLLVLLLLSVLSSITFGPVDIAIPDVARILVCRIFRSEPAPVCRTPPEYNRRYHLEYPVSTRLDGNGGGGRSVCLWCGDAGGSPQSTGGSLCIGAFLRRFTGCHTGDPPGGFLLVWELWCVRGCVPGLPGHRAICLYRGVFRKIQGGTPLNCC